MKKLLFILLLFPALLNAQYTDYRYASQYCLVTDKTTGEIVVNEFITSGRVETAQNIARIENLNGVKNSALSSVIPNLPDVGQWVEKDKLYKYGTQIIQCIQSHFRSPNAPETTPNLFSFYRAETADMQWIINEKVVLNAERIYNSVKYKCIQAHMTQGAWNPVATLGTLWQIVQSGTAWAVGVAYKVNDIVTYNGSTYKCLQAHTSISTWYPSAVPALWQKQ